MDDPSSIVFVVDDDAAVRTAIESLLRSAGLAVRSFGSAHEFLMALPAEPDVPGCVILEARLSGTSGLELQRQLAERDPSSRVIFISGDSDILMSVRAMKAGAKEFLAKPFREQELLDAVQQCLAQAGAARRTNAELAELHTRAESLTPREREVMTFVVAGRINKQIAYQLGISEVTVKIHRGQMMHKMHADSVADLVRMTERAGVGPARS